MISHLATKKNIISYSLNGHLRKKDYQKISKDVEKVKSTFSNIHIMISLSNFKGWKLRALFAGIRFSVKNALSIKKVAVIGDSKLHRYSTAAYNLFSCPKVKYFYKGKERKAISWLASATPESTLPVIQK